MTWRLDPHDLADTAFRYDPETDAFKIDIPQDSNIAADTVGQHARGPRADRAALVFEGVDGSRRAFTYHEVDDAANRLASTLRARGIGKGDRVAVHSVQRPETVIAHMACYKLGAVAATVSQLTGPDTMAHILGDCGARVIVTHSERWAPFRDLRRELDALAHCIVVGDATDDEISFADCLAANAKDFTPARTGPEDPALLIYTSGSTGLPKGILHGHRILPALNATIELFYNLELREEALVFWTPADWAWIGGLNDVIFAALTFGHTLMVSEHRFDPDWALGFMARHGVTHGLLMPTALKRLAQAAETRRPKDLRLRTIFTGGEPLPGETHRALSDGLGIVCNEGYGLSEVNQMIGNCQRLRPVRPGSMGWSLPGHRVRLVDERGVDVPDGDVGEIVVSADDPTLFLGYWNRLDLTDSIRLGQDWIRTHDLATRDADGYYWYQGRNDDLIKSAGVRIGPAEIEDALLRHPAVADAGVVGVPDSEGSRTMVVKAFVRLADGVPRESALAEELRRHVKKRVGPYKQPRIVEFVDDLPTTGTGKIARAALRRLDAERRRAEVKSSKV